MKSVTVNQNIIDLEYAVRGPIPQRAAKLKQQGKNIIPCNIGNPQALGQKPITFYREVLSLLENPNIIEREKYLYQNPINKFDNISNHAINVSEKLLTTMETGLGAYTDSKGQYFIRESVAKFIDKRDSINSSKSYLQSNPDNVFLTDGASEGAKAVLELLISDKNDGIMIPIPQYPLYSATIKRCGGTQINYYPNEDNDWALNKEILEDSLQKAKYHKIDVKAIVVINPANPTGAILDSSSIMQVIDFAEENGLSIIADEVYQENLYGGEFISFAKAINNRKIPLFSLHSASKGYYGECGQRGGYLEVRNPPKINNSEIPFINLLFKLSSVNLCSNTIGQALVYLMVNPPQKGTDAFDIFTKEKRTILDDLFNKATLIRNSFKNMDGMECFGKIGALYLFPRLNKLPDNSNDFDYCMSLLEETGLCVVNGSGFGQKAGTHHLRIAFLPSIESLKNVLPSWTEFHNKYVNQ
ncbi:aminotransferase class I/II-fold pyridoxal phosphate-dependent enzyme [bacterium]|nr:aminotransferase class I/II-fold pyridoxal phosphate-dependent enzyme [bacterium]